MDSTLPLLRQASDSGDKIGSTDADTTDQTLDIESGTIHEMNKPVPGIWRFPTNRDLCCIYRVPTCIRKANPEAYTPQLVLIGPLHHSLRSKALKSLGDITDAKLMDYFNMEERKKTYLAEFARRVEGKKTIGIFKRIIEEEEVMIRASYSESTAWIESPKFVEMILHDSVFILEFLLRASSDINRLGKTGDLLMDEPCLGSLIKEDLILLENQLPYFILERLFEPIVQILRPTGSFWELIITFFNFEGKIESCTNFRHFTDLFRCARVETLPENCVGDFDRIDHMYNADKLHSGGVKFKPVKDKESIDVKFEKGCLKIPCLYADMETIIRNIIAFEQCHFPFNAHFCNYIIFLDFLINTEKDIELLVEKGIIKNWSGHHGKAAEMVSKLCSGVIGSGSYYSKIAEDVTTHYKNKCNKSRSILKSVYFNNMWRGTATVAATFLLLLTLIQTVTSIIDVFRKSTPP